MKANLGADVCVDVFLTSALVGRVFSFTLLSPYSLGKYPRYPVDMRLGGPQCRLGIYGEVKTVDPAGTRTATPRLFSP
jgi:hypothetical protein